MQKPIHFYKGIPRVFFYPDLQESKPNLAIYMACYVHVIGFKHTHIQKHTAAISETKTCWLVF